jgi:hypothetical protein
MMPQPSRKLRASGKAGAGTHSLASPEEKAHVSYPLACITWLAWTEILLIVGTIGFFLHQGPGGAIASTVPLFGIMAAGVCFLLVFPVAGLRLWKG